jgi:RNA-directed DNA polymerase
MSKPPTTWKGSQYEHTVPNTVDRVAQTAAAMLLEDKLEPIFHPDSYGYRRGRSAHDALAVTRKRCWDKDWVVDFDIRAFLDVSSHCSFDSLS